MTRNDMATGSGKPCDRSGQRVLWAGILLFTVIAFVVYARMWGPELKVQPDSSGYMEVAQDLRDLRLDELHRRTPGYPLLLLLTGSSEGPSQVLLYVQLAFHAVGVLALAWLLTRLGVHSAVVALFVLVGWVPTMVQAVPFMLTEAMATFLLIAGFTGLIVWLDGGRWPWLLIAGLALGLEGITHPIYQLLPAALAGTIVLLVLVYPPLRRQWKRFLAGGAAVVVAGAIFVGGYVLHNRVRFDFTGVSPMAAEALALKTTRYLERIPDEHAEVREALIRHRDAKLIRRGSDHDGMGYNRSVIPELEELTGLTGGELSKYWMKVNLDLIKRAPMNFQADVARSLGTYWLPAVNDYACGGSRAGRLFLALGMMGVHALFFLQAAVTVGVVFFLVCMALGSRRRLLGLLSVPLPWRLSAWTLGIVVISYTMLFATVFGTGNPRNRFPTELLLVFVMLVGLDSLARIGRAARQSGEIQQGDTMEGPMRTSAGTA